MASDSGGHNTVTPLPPSVTAEDAIAFLHDHSRMIDLNPLVINHEPTGPGLNAPQEQVEQFCWYLITDAVSYLPGQNGVKTDVSYKAAYQNRLDGLRTYTYAPGGIDISSTWTVEEEITTSGSRLCLKERVDMACDGPIASFITRNSDRTHAALVDAILAKMEEDSHRKAVIQEILMTERSERRELRKSNDRPNLASRPSKSTRGPRLSIVMPPPRLSSEALCARGRHGPDCPHNFVATHGAIDAYSPGLMASPMQHTPVFKTPVYNTAPISIDAALSTANTPAIAMPAMKTPTRMTPTTKTPTTKTRGLKTPLSARQPVRSAAPAGLPALLNRLGSADRVMTMSTAPPPMPRAASSDKVPILSRAVVKPLLPNTPAVILEPPSASEESDIEATEVAARVIPSIVSPMKTPTVASHPPVPRPMLDRTAACDKVPMLVELPAPDLLTMKPLPPILPEERVADLGPIKRKPVAPPLLRADSAEYTPRFRPASRTGSRNNSSEQTPTLLHNKSPRLNPEEVAKIFAAYSPIAEHPCFCEEDTTHDEDCPFYDSDTSSSSNDEASSPDTPPQRHAELATVATETGLVFQSTDLKPLPLNVKCSLRRQKKQPAKRLTIVIPPLPEYLQE